MLPVALSRIPFVALAALLLAACDGGSPGGTAPGEAASADGASAQPRIGARGAVLRIEAEHARLVGSMREGADEGASGGHYAGVTGKGVGDDMKDYAEFTFRTAAAGTYRLRGRVRGPRGNANSFFVQAVGGETLTWHTAVSGADYVEEYVERGGEPVELQLSAGAHTVRVFRRENSTRLDWFELVPVGTEADATAVAQPVLPAVLRIEAERARLVGSMREGADKGASGGRYASVSGTGSGRDMKAYAEFTFRTAAAGTYRLRGRTRGPHREANSFFVKVADGDTFTWHTARSGARYVEEYVGDGNAPVEVRLPAGESTVRVYRRERGTRLDWLELERQPAAAGEDAEVEIADASDGGSPPVDGGTSVPSVPPLSAAKPDTARPDTARPDADGTDGDGLTGEEPVAASPDPFAPVAPVAPVAPATDSSEPAAADPDPLTADPLKAILRLEAEAGRLSGAMAVGTDGGASGGRYVSVPGNGSGRELVDYVELSFRTTVAASYRLRARVRGPRKEANSFFVGIGDSEVWAWHAPLSGAYYAEEYVGRDGDEVRVWLPAGTHAVRVYRREKDTRLDWVELEKVPGGEPQGGGEAIVVTSVGSGDGAAVPSSMAAAGGSGDTRAPVTPEPARKVVSGASGSRDGNPWRAAGFGTVATMSGKELARIAEIERLLKSDAKRDVNKYQCR